jgi:hypothetical protein
MATRQSYLGIQDAARKVRPASRSPGAWAGVVVHVDPHAGVSTLASQEKWDRMKKIFQDWNNILGAGVIELNHA